jgi:acetolactate synthase-1/2/3 large subunit
LSFDLAVKADAKSFLSSLNARLADVRPLEIAAWTDQIRRWKKSYPTCPPSYYEEELLNPYVFVRTLSQQSVAGDAIFIDTGCSIAWMMQAFETKEGQRLIHDFNNTAMGYALPASIGACYGLGGRPITCVTGDGSLQMNIQELATVMRHRLPIKIFLVNNHGYSMIQQTQDQWMGSNYVASSVEGGLASPDFVKVAEAYGFKTSTIARTREAAAKIREVFETPGPFFCNVEIRPEHRVIPQCKFGKPIEDSEPLLPRDEFARNMLVPPLP